MDCCCRTLQLIFVNEFLRLLVICRHNIWNCILAIYISISRHFIIEYQTNRNQIQCNCKNQTKWNCFRFVSRELNSFKFYFQLVFFFCFVLFFSMWNYSFDFLCILLLLFAVWVELKGSDSKVWNCIQTSKKNVLNIFIIFGSTENCLSTRYHLNSLFLVFVVVVVA